MASVVGIVVGCVVVAGASELTGSLVVAGASDVVSVTVVTSVVVKG